jgi:Flp pilus assembly protein TadG
MLRRNNRRGEWGSAMAEFAIVAGFFFMIIIGIIEFSRLLYTHNALTDAARRGARYAALHREADETCAVNAMIYGEANIGAPPTCTPTGPPLIGGLQRQGVDIVFTYEGADLDNNPDTPQTSYGTNLGTVTVTIENYTFDLGIPYFGPTLTLPKYKTSLTAESAGEEPDPI